MDATETLNDCRIVPVVVIDDHAYAIELAATLLEAGIKAIEVTLRTPAALDAIRLIAENVPGILVGAGSIRHPEHFDHIADSGAGFAVSPGASNRLIDAAQKAHMPFVPGGSNATDIINLLEKGYLLQKFFPAELSGGTAMLKALSAPLPEVRFFPTGGITAELAPSYLKLDCVNCIGGTWFVSPALIMNQEFQRIGELAEAAVRVAHE
ncbi:MAG: 2-dehydro-3-deoxyphosphogluconate aldolase/(4S)-4-hydroxy-2-oxoglutarate aldolase [Candidatus Azotimanducaceae bacterium]|jgi:2-dehydro-3-deoxyphosphogluconate aldolase/(4S)-4-hydroxy-2-oxoglutarate aldolase